MPRQRDWDSLSERTRKGYTGTGANRFGWSAEQVRAHYESGDSLKALRRQTASTAFRQSGGKTAKVIGTGGVGDIKHLTTSERRMAAQHWHAVDRYLKGGGSGDYISKSGKLVRGLDYFEGRDINGVELETRRGSLEDRWAFGELDTSIYDLGEGE